MVKKGITTFFIFLGVSSMKQFLNTTALKAVLVGVVISGMATACQNGDSTIGGFLPKEEQAATGAKAGGAVTQGDEERKAEQARKIAEFLAKPEVKEMSAGLEEIAQAVAVAVEDKALTERIYEKCMEKFDGETNTLWMHLEADSKVKSQGGWNKRVGDVLDKGRKNATVKGIGNVDAAIKKFEKTVGAPLHLFWMYPSAWDKKTTPLIAFVPFDVNPKTRTSIPAFDAKGNRFELGNDGGLAKKRPILVITVNERTIASGNLKEGLVIGESHEITAKSPNNLTSKKLLQPKSSDQIQSRTILGQIQVYTYGISAQWTDPEYEGSPEFFYVFTTQESWVSTYQSLGTSRGGFLGISHSILRPGNNYKSWVKYWEADYIFFLDDFIDEHTLTNWSPVQDGYTAAPGSGGGCTSLTNNVYSVYVYITR
jgi:hypothetical protein